MSTGGRGALVVAAAGLLVLAMAACGVPDGGGYQAAGPGEIPFGLQDTTTTTSTTTTVAAAPSTTVVESPSTTVASTTSTVATEPVGLYFVLQSRLARVERAVRRPVDPSDALNLLVAGPTTADAPPGLRSSVPDAAVGSVSVTGGTATVDLNPAVLELSPGEQVLAFAQVALTLTDRPGIGRVLFTVRGRPIDAVRADGTLSSGSVSREDYESMLEGAPPRTTVATTTVPSTSPTTSVAPTTGPPGPVPAAATTAPRQ